MRDRVRQIELGALLAGAGAVVLLVSLFLDWYQPGLTAWHAFEVVDLLLAALALLVLLAVIDELGIENFARAEWLPAAGTAALVLVAAELINHPPAALGHPPGSGAWLALGGAAAMLAGGVLTAAHVSVTVTFDSAARGPRRRPLRRPGKPPPPPPARGPADPATTELPPDPPR